MKHAHRKYKDASIPLYTPEFKDVARQMRINADIIMQEISDHAKKEKEDFLDEIARIVALIPKEALDKLPTSQEMRNQGWIRCCDRPPEHDQNVFVINKKVPMHPLKAYYCEEWEEFMSLENGDGTNHPISATHWMPLPEQPVD